MGSEHDKHPGTARDHRLHDTIADADEPSSSYAFHDDEARVEQVRTSAVARGKGDASHSLWGRSQRARAQPGGSGRPALSEPPEVGSWPPLPNVPGDLALAARQTAPDGENGDDAQTVPPHARHSETPASGAIWGAIPSVVKSAGPHNLNEGGAGGVAPPQEVTITALGGPPEAAKQAAESAPRYRERDLERLEPLVARGAWEQLAKELQGEGARSAVHRLMLVIARRETAPADDKGAGHKLTQDAIVALADLLGVPANSPMALMLAKRLLRRNPVWAAKQPDARVSFGVVMVGLLVGVGIGWALKVFAL